MIQAPCTFVLRELLPTRVTTGIVQSRTNILVQPDEGLYMWFMAADSIYQNQGRVSVSAKRRILALVAQGAKPDEIYEAIGRSGQAVDRLVAEAIATRPVIRRKSRASEHATAKRNTSVRRTERNMVDHRFWLRADVAVVLSLPGDLRADEAARLAEVVRNLPFLKG